MSKEKKHTNLIVDVNNIAWIVRFGEKLDEKKVDPLAAELIAAKMIEVVGDLSIQFKADGVLAAYDSSRVWRKTVYPDYKNRPHDDIYYEAVKAAIDITREFFDTHTSVKTSKVDYSEADDIIAVAVQNSDKDQVRNVIVSTDRDFMQLLSFDNTLLFNPTKRDFRESDDPEYYLFEKCIRGDKSDNIFSAFPRVRSTRLEKAYDDPSEMLSLLETKRKDGVRVGDEYEFNRTLIDLTRQPEHIRDSIQNDLNLSPKGSYNQTGAMKYVRDKKMKTLMEKFLSGEYRQGFSGSFLQSFGNDT